MRIDIDGETKSWQRSEVEYPLLVEQCSHCWILLEWQFP